VKLLRQAILLSTSPQHRGKFRLGAVGLRADGVIVTAKSGGWPGQYLPATHAEARLANKLTPGSVVYVARTLKDGTIAMAKPCKACQNALRHRGVKRVYYTIANNEFGVMSL
jgi:tRNA(Arg) A34 adenosine deaminase TadA